MTDVRHFDCPTCGGDSSLDMETLKVTHAEPKCPAWIEMAALQAKAPSEVAILDAPPAPAPDVIEFACPDCSRNVRMYPNRKPLGIQHAMPPCPLWEKIEGKKDDVARYLIKAGAHVHVPPPDSEQS